MPTRPTAGPDEGEACRGCRRGRLRWQGRGREGGACHSCRHGRGRGWDVRSPPRLPPSDAPAMSRGRGARGRDGASPDGEQQDGSILSPTLGVEHVPSTIGEQQNRALMTHKCRGSIVVLLISKSFEPNEEQKVLKSGFQHGFTSRTERKMFMGFYYNEQIKSK